MMSHQAGNTIASTDPAQKAGTVQRVKPGVGHRRPIPDVVQPRRRHQGTIGQPKSLSNLLRPVPNTLDMPPSRQLSQAPAGENPRISRRYHGFEPMRGNKQDSTWCRARCPTMHWPRGVLPTVGPAVAWLQAQPGSRPQSGFTGSKGKTR
jgi:hypothetical protein